MTTWLFVKTGLTTSYCINAIGQSTVFVTKDAMDNHARIIIPGGPATKKNSQVIRCYNGKPVVIQSKSYRTYEKAALKALQPYQNLKFSGPVEVTALYWLKDNRRPDLNNLMAATADILEKAGIVKNDRDIISWDGSRIMGTSPNPRAEIVIRAANRVQSIFGGG